jgi:hypothetical protein
MKVKKRNYLIELNTWKKGAFVYNSKHITLNKSMVNLYEVIIKEKAMRCRRRECLWWKIAMEVARGGNDRVYTRFKLLSYASTTGNDAFWWWLWMVFTLWALCGIQTCLKRVKFSRKCITEKLFRALLYDSDICSDYCINWMI